MKKISALLSVVLSVASLSSCNKEFISPVENNPVEGNIPFVLSASIPETKLSLGDDWQFTWDEGDVIYAVTTDKEWGFDFDNSNPETESIAEFTCGDTGFTTLKTIADGVHTFNFLYAPSSQKSYHRGGSTTYRINASQNQDCSAPTANLKNYYPLAGQATITTPASVLNSKMSHLATIVKVTLKNKTGNDITVSSFKIDMAGADVSGIYTVIFGENPSLAKKSENGSSVTVNLSNGNMAANAEVPVYVVMAPVSNFDGQITFTAADSDGSECSKTNTVSGLSFEPGTYNEASFSLKNFVSNGKSVTFDLSKNETTTASENQLVWRNSIAIMQIEKSNSLTNANNYYPGKDGQNYTSTRMYKNSAFSLTPVSGITITKAVFNATTPGYATEFANSSWTNATATANEKTVTVIPNNGITAISAILGGTTGFTSVDVYYNGEAEGTTVTAPAAFYDFSKIAFSDWSTSYTEHDVEYDECSIKFTSANHSTSTITDIPVTKGADVIVKMKQGFVIESLELKCEQWTTKTQTITLNTSTDGGNNFTATSVKSSEFTLAADNLTNVNAVKFTFSSSSNQVGIKSLSINGGSASEGGGDGGEDTKTNPTITSTNKIDLVVNTTYDVSQMFESNSDGVFSFSITGNPGNAGSLNADGKTFTATQTGTYTITATLSETASYYSASKTATIVVISTGGTPTYTKVTDASALKTGDKFIIACDSKNTYAGPMLGNSYFTSVSSKSEAIVITLNGNADSCRLITSEGTIGTSKAKELSKTSGTQTWKISIDSSGNASIASTNNSYGTIMYNASSPRFLNYTSGQTSVQMYLVTGM